MRVILKIAHTLIKTKTKYKNKMTEYRKNIFHLDCHEMHLLQLCSFKGRGIYLIILENWNLILIFNQINSM